MTSISSTVMRLALLFAALACGSVTAESEFSARKLLVSSTGSNITVSNRDLVLAQLNSVRATYQAQPLKWSTTVAAYAQSSANTCVLSHNSAQLTKTNQGEDLYGYTGSLNWTRAVAAWTSEVKNYNFGNPGFSQSTGHFTQVVWQDTKAVGCGYTECKGTFNIYSCRFFPAGNYIGQFKTEVKPPRG